MKRRTVVRACVGAVGSASLLGSAGGRRDRTGGQRQHFEPVGSVDVPGATDAVVDRDGAVTYVATEDGFAVVNTSTPETPRVVAERRDVRAGDGRQLRMIWDLGLDGDRLIAAGPAHHRADALSGFALFDVEDPSAPEQLAFYETPDHYVHNCEFDDGTVYLTGNGLPDQPLVVIDVTDDEPREVGRWSITDHDDGYGDVAVTLRTLHDVFVRDGVAALSLWDAGTWIVDVADPADPEVRSQVGPYTLADLRDISGSEASLESRTVPGNAHTAALNANGTMLAVGEEAWAVTVDGQRRGGPGGLVLYDVSDDTDPVERARIEAPPAEDQTRDGQFTTAHNFGFAGDRLYSSWYFGGVKVHDVADPTSPRELAHWRSPDETSFWTALPLSDGIVAVSSNLAAKLGTDVSETREAVYVFSDPPGERTGDSDGDGQPAGSTPDATGPGFGIGSALLAGGAATALARWRSDSRWRE